MQKLEYAIDAAVAAERVSVPLLERLRNELDPDLIRSVGEALTELADKVGDAVDLIETWAEAERGEDRHLAKDDAVAALEELNDGYTILGEYTDPAAILALIGDGPLDEDAEPDDEAPAAAPSLDVDTVVLAVLNAIEPGLRDALTEVIE